MAIAFVQSKSAQASAAASVTTAGITTTTGNFVTAVAVDPTLIPGTTSVTDSNSNTWTQDQVSSATPGLATYHASNITGGASHTFTYTRASSTNSISIAIAEFSGMGTTPAVDQTTRNTANSTPPMDSTATGTTTHTNELVIGAADQVHVVSDLFSTPNFTEVLIAVTASQEGVSQGLFVSTDTQAKKYEAAGSTSANEGVGIATFKGSSPAFVQSKTAQANATSVTTAGMTTTTGNFLVAGPAAFTRTFSGSPITDSNSNTWQNAWVANTGTNGHAACYYAENITGGAGHTVTYTSGGAADFLAIGVSECSGINTSASLDKTASTNDASAPQDSGFTATLSQATELVVGVCSLSHTGALGSLGFQPSVWADTVAAKATASLEGILLSYQIVSSTGTFRLFSVARGGLSESIQVVTYAPSGGGASLTIRRPAPLNGLGTGSTFFGNPLALN